MSDVDRPEAREPDRTAGSDRPEPPGDRYIRRALEGWPRLDRARLRRTGGDPVRIARLVAKRTKLSVDEIVRHLVRDRAAHE
jgi:hypothetical protein